MSPGPLATPPDLASVLQALADADAQAAEARWEGLRRAAPDEVETWILGVRLAGWRGDRAAAQAREANARRLLPSAAIPWLARHQLALAAAEASARAGDLRGALPLAGEALGQTEWQPGHPAAVAALLTLASLHALHLAPRKALALVERALARAAAPTPQRAGPTHEPPASGAPPQGAPPHDASIRALARRARWVRLVVALRLGQCPSPAGARRATRLARAWALAGWQPQALQLRADAAVVAADDDALQQVLALAAAAGLGGVHGRSQLLQLALAARGGGPGGAPGGGRRGA